MSAGRLKPVRVLKVRHLRALPCNHVVPSGGQIVGILQPDGKTRRWVCMACRLAEIRVEAAPGAG